MPLKSKPNKMRPPFKSNNQQSSSDAAMFNNLWVGNLDADVTDSDLRNLFEKYGVVDAVTCYPSRSYAFVNMNRPEDAKTAKDAIQGFLLRGAALKIDFAKPARPCKSLWVSGISISTSKEDLEEEFSKFGKIVDFKFLREKNTAYVDYARLEDATKALKMMHGKYRGGSVLRVDYLRSNSKRHIPPLEGRKGVGEQPCNVLVISYPPVVHVDEQMLHNAMILFGEIDNIRSFPSSHYSLVEFRSVEEAQLAKDGLQGRLFNDPRISIMYSNNEHAPNKDITGFHAVKGPRLPPHGVFNEFSNLGQQLDVYGHPVIMPNNLPGRDIPIMSFAPPDSFDPLLQGPEFNMPPGTNPVGGPNYRRGSPNLSTRLSPGTWDAFDSNQLHREPKRMRTDGNIPLRDTKDQVLGLDPVYSGVPQAKGVGRSETKFPVRGTERGQPNSDYIWRGLIAKGGTPVCHARCVPIIDWTGYDIPEVVNCSARTGLDMLAKHYTDAVGFDIIFFLPDSEEDFASYTEFVRYLGDRNRAGVAKFDDGTTLFLVPPSEFLSKVLNVSGPERLYGVVLKFSQHTSASTSAGPLLTQPQYIDKQQVPSHSDYNILSGGDKVLQIDYSGVPHEDMKSNPKSTGPPTRNPLAPPPPPPLPPPAITTSTSQTGLSLTPELIATLASLAKGKLSGQQSSGPPAVVPNERPLKGWEYEPVGHLNQQTDSIFHAQPQILPQHQSYQSNMVNNSHLTSAANFPPIQDYHFSTPQHEVVPTVSTSQPLRSGQFVAPMQPSQPYLPGYGFEQKQDVGSVLPSGTSLYGGNNVYQPQNVVVPPPENPGLQLPEQMQQQLQSALYASSQQPSDFDAHKNERYQSTLQFATNLLLQIHKQQPDTQSGQGGGSHQ